MVIFYARYAFLFWFFVGTNQGQLMRLSQISEDETLLNVTSCTQNCIEIGEKVRMCPGTQPQKCWLVSFFLEKLF